MTIEELQAELLKTKEALSQTAAERDKLRADGEKAANDLATARKLNQDLVNKLVAGVDLTRRKEINPEPRDLESASLEWYNKK